MVVTLPIGNAYMIHYTAADIKALLSPLNHSVEPMFDMARAGGGQSEGGRRAREG